MVYNYWLKCTLLTVRGVVVIMLSHTVDGGPPSIKTEPHTQSREYIKKKDGKLC